MKPTINVKTNLPVEMTSVNPTTKPSAFNHNERREQMARIEKFWDELKQIRSNRRANEDPSEQESLLVYKIQRQVLLSRLEKNIASIERAKTQKEREKAWLKTQKVIHEIKGLPQDVDPSEFSHYLQKRMAKIRPQDV